MFKSIFAKQFTLYVGILFASYFSLFIAMSIVFNSYFISKTEENLIKQGQNIVKVFETSPSYNGGILSIRDLKMLDYEVSLLNQYLDVNLIVVNKDFEVFIITSNFQKFLGKGINVPELYPVMDGEIVSARGRLDNIFDEMFLTVAYPIVSNNIVIGAILLNSSIEEVQHSIQELGKITLITSIVFVSISFILIYISSLKMTRPLTDINNAAKIIAAGDFEKRIKVKTRDEVGQLGESFNYMAQSLYSQEQYRNEFISNISHDIRTPLTSMRGFLQAILDGTIPKEKKEHYLNIVMNETIRLSKMANDLLDLNSIHNIEINRSKFDINELIRKTLFMFEERINDKKISIVINFNLEKNIVIADYDKIQRVVYNLIDNAVKFTDTEPIITIETCIEENKLLVKIKDNGPGVILEKQNKIFDRFYKVDESRGIHKSGSGLGLSIVKAFINAHDEKIMLKSDFSEGCEFIFTMTLA